MVPLLSAVQAGCGDDETTAEQLPEGDGDMAVNPDYFVADNLAAEITTEACTLSGGTETTCYRITTKGTPDHQIGPFCPSNIEDDASAGGKWPEDGVFNDLDGAFIEQLATFYDDANWQLYDPATGDINITDTEVSCAAAAQPNVDPMYQNHCVECSIDYVDGGVERTYLIPTTPVPLAENSATTHTDPGVSLNGVVYNLPAPVADILSNYTIAAFDDCGGHINLAAGYHYHGAAGCSEQIAQTDGHAPLIGYAMDGYGMFSMLDGDDTEPGDLDECRGHEDDTRGYHYHVAGPGENLFIGCFHGETVAVDDGGGPGAGGGAEVMDCTTADQTMCCGDGTCDGPETADNCADCQ